MLQFSKYQGTGNDFILIDNRGQNFKKDNTQIADLCDRRFGIGGDGLILLENTPAPKTDFKMVYFNADGGESSMCGNGGRCLVKFAHALGIFGKQTRFLATDGLHRAKIKNNLVSLKMGNISRVKNQENGYCIDSGSPHYLKFVKNIDQIDVKTEGARIRYGPSFAKNGINVNFIEPGTSSHKIRTYERGVEDETLSCGTGVVAAALALYVDGKTASHKIQLETRGGPLGVRFQKAGNGFTDIWLTGPAEKSFEGQITVPT